MNHLHLKLMGGRLRLAADRLIAESRFAPRAPNITAVCARASAQAVYS